jgi:hypothetical protein
MSTILPSISTVPVPAVAKAGRSHQGLNVRDRHVPALETALDAAQGLALMTDDHGEGARAFKEKCKPACKAQ